MKKGGSISTKQGWHCTFKLTVLILMVFGIMIPLFIQVALLLQQNNSKDDAYLTSRMILYDDLEVKKSKIDALETHLKELESVKMKALQALMQLDKKRVSLLQEIQENTYTRNTLLSEVKSYHQQVQKSKKELSFMQESRSQKIVKNVIHVGVPKKLDTSLWDENINFKDFSAKETQQCSFKSCFDYSKCPLLHPFSFYSAVKSSSMYNLLQTFSEFNPNPKQACIHINTHTVSELQKLNINDKRNNLVILETSKEDDVKTICSTLENYNFKKAVLMLPHLCHTYRTGYDYILPKSLPDFTYNLWTSIPPLFPVHRQYILAFHSVFKELQNYTTTFKKDLELLHGSEKDISIDLDCSATHKQCTAGWCSCGSHNQVAKNAVFVLIPLEFSNSMFLDSLIDSLHVGCIPVFIGSFELLPFSNVIDWRKAAILFPHQRLPELMYVLRTMLMDDLITLKQQGRFLYETYLSSKKLLLRTMISHLKFNIGLPPTAIEDFKALNINNETGVPMPSADFSTMSFSLHQLNRNFSYIGQSLYEVWNSFPGAINMYPVDPWRQPPPSEIQFLEEGKYNFMPIGDGKGGDGSAFSRSLGGDYAVEQFTVLMLTYDREVILMEALQRLSGMKYLNKVIVVWNHPVNPSKNLQWPDIGVKIEVCIFVILFILTNYYLTTTFHTGQKMD